MKESRRQSPQKPIREQPTQMKEKMVKQPNPGRGDTRCHLWVTCILNMEGISQYQRAAHPEAVEASKKSNDEWREEVEKHMKGLKCTKVPKGSKVNKKMQRHTQTLF